MSLEHRIGVACMRAVVAFKRDGFNGLGSTGRALLDELSDVGLDTDEIETAAEAAVLREAVDLMHPNGHTCEHGNRPGYDCAECQPEIDASLAKHETDDAEAEVVRDMTEIANAIELDSAAARALQRVASVVDGLFAERRFVSGCVDEIRAKLAKLEDENARLRADNARWCARVKRVESRIDDAVDRLRGVGLPSAPEVFEHAGATSEDVESAIAFLDPNDAGTPIGPDDHAPGFEVVRALAKISAAMKARGT